LQAAHAGWLVADSIMVLKGAAQQPRGNATMRQKAENEAPAAFLRRQGQVSKPPGLPVAELDMLERRHLRLNLLKAGGEECVEIGFLDPDAAAPALATEAVMLEQSLRAPLIDERIRDTDSRGNLFRREHRNTYLSMP